MSKINEKRNCIFCAAPSSGQSGVCRTCQKKHWGEDYAEPQRLSLGHQEEPNFDWEPLKGIPLN